MSKSGKSKIMGTENHGRPISGLANEPSTGTGIDKRQRQSHGQSKDAKPVMVMLNNHQIAFLDRISASIREKSGDSVKRAALIRAMIDAMEEQDIHRILEDARSEAQVREILTQCIDGKRYR